eukprot:2762900-Pyramimonas_sp.AAC.2
MTGYPDSTGNPDRRNERDIYYTIHSQRDIDIQSDTYSQTVLYSTYTSIRFVLSKRPKPVCRVILIERKLTNFTFLYTQFPPSEGIRTSLHRVGTTRSPDLRRAEHTRLRTWRPSRFTSCTVALENAIKSKYPAVEVTGEATPEASGKLEVQIVGGELLHSKANGDGYVDSPGKITKILDGIGAAVK